MIRRFVLLAAAASVAALAVGGTALAHIDPDPAQAQAGSRLTIGFTIEHGCEGSPTVQIDMRLAEGVTDPVPEPVDGWTPSVDADVVTYVGGPLPDDEEGTFEITMTMPATVDTSIFFPIVQRCEVGEIRWIGLPTASGDEPVEPAPAVRLIGPVVTTEPTATVAPAPSPTAPLATEPAPVATDVPDATEATSATTVATTDTEPVLISASVDEPGDTGTGTIVFIVSIIVVLALGGFVAYRARQGRAAGHGNSIPDDAD